jgi:hypothetical protein
MPDKGWKKAERMLARDVGTQRIPVTGIDRHGADFVAGPFRYQAKVRKVIPKFLFDWLHGICASAATYGQTGVLVVNRPHRPRSEALVILRWRDWCDEHGAPPIPEVADDGKSARPIKYTVATCSHPVSDADEDIWRNTGGEGGI